MLIAFFIRITVAIAVITNVFITIVILTVSMARGVVHTSVLHHLSYALTTKKMMKKNTKHNERIEKLWQM
jgi:hypothetical protein